MLGFFAAFSLRSLLSKRAGEEWPRWDLHPSLGAITLTR